MLKVGETLFIWRFVRAKLLHRVLLKINPRQKSHLTEDACSWEVLLPLPSEAVTSRDVPRSETSRRKSWKRPDDNVIRLADNPTRGRWIRWWMPHHFRLSTFWVLLFNKLKRYFRTAPGRGGRMFRTFDILIQSDWILWITLIRKLLKKYHGRNPEACSHKSYKRLHKVTGKTCLRSFCKSWMWNILEVINNKWDIRRIRNKLLFFSNYAIRNEIHAIEVIIKIWPTTSRHCLQVWLK